MRAFASSARVNGDGFTLIKNGRNRVEFGVARTNERVWHVNGVGQFIVCSGIRDVRRHHEHGDAPSRQCCLAGRDRLAAGLLGRENHLAEDTAAPVHVGEVDLLDRFETQVLSHDLGRDQDDGRAVAMGLVEPVDEVKAAGTAASRAGSETAGQQCLGRGGEGASLFVPHVDPIDLAAVDGMRNPVQRVADDPIASLYAGSL